MGSSAGKAEEEGTARPSKSLATFKTETEMQRSSTTLSEGLANPATKEERVTTVSQPERRRKTAVSQPEGGEKENRQKSL